MMSRQERRHLSCRSSEDTFNLCKTLLHVSFPSIITSLTTQFTFKHTQQTPSTHSKSIKMSGTSNVGNSGVYEAQDQRTYKDSEIAEQKQEARFHEGKEHSHKANDASKNKHLSPLLLHNH